MLELLGATEDSSPRGEQRGPATQPSFRQAPLTEPEGERLDELFLEPGQVAVDRELLRPWVTGVEVEAISSVTSGACRARGVGR